MKATKGAFMKSLLIIMALVMSFAVQADLTETEKAETALAKITELLATDLDPAVKTHLNKMRVGYEKDIVVDKVVREVAKHNSIKDIDEKIAIQNARDLNLECVSMIAQYEGQYRVSDDIGKEIIVEVTNLTGINDTSSCYSRALVFYQDGEIKTAKTSWVSHADLITYFDTEVAENIAKLNISKAAL